MTNIERLMATGLTTGQAARRLGVSQQHVDVLTRSGKLAHIKTPLGRLIDPQAVAELDARRQAQREVAHRGRA
jgi:excisionase family DNA binding protein